MLIDKTVSFKSSHDVARMKDPVVLRHRAKELIPTRNSNARPAAGGDRRSRLNNGTRLTDHVEAVRGPSAAP
jgi:hypothetical protein